MSLFKKKKLSYFLPTFVKIGLLFIPMATVPFLLFSFIDVVITFVFFPVLDRKLESHPGYT